MCIRDRIKGFTKFTMPFTVTSIRKLDDDRIAVLGGQEVYEMDFSDKDHMIDLIAGERETYPYIIRPLPLLRLTEKNFSVTKNAPIRSIIVGASGDIYFRYQIIDSIKGLQTETEFRHHDKDNALDRGEIGGQFWINNIPSNGSTLPELRIIKEDDKYIEINSINIELGDY